MPPRLRTAPRKKPVQARSAATVDTILQATAKLLAKEGYDHLSTNRVAEAAGVSIGSLYQYFPSKEALVAALADGHRERMLALVLDRLAELRDAPPEQAVRTAIRAIVDAHAREPALTRALREQVPRIGKLKDILESVEVHAAGALRSNLEHRAENVRRKNIPLAAWLVAHTVDAAVHAALMGNAPGSLDELTDELTDLVLRYLHDVG